MALSTEAQQQLIAFVNSRWTKRTCPMCAANDWTIHSYVPVTIAQMPVSPMGNGLLPTAVFVCNNCGNTVFVNLRVAGVVGEGGISVP